MLIAQKAQCNYESPAVNLIKSSNQMRRNSVYSRQHVWGLFLSNLLPSLLFGIFLVTFLICILCFHLYSCFSFFFHLLPSRSLLLYLWSPPVGMLSPTGGCSLWPGSHGSSPAGRQAGRQDESRTHHPRLSYLLKLLFSFLSLCVAGRHRVYLCISLSIIYIFKDF